MPRPKTASSIEVRVVPGSSRHELMTPAGGITTEWLRAVMDGKVEGIPRVPDRAVWTTENGHVSLSW
jgi:hypothetical protein